MIIQQQKKNIKPVLVPTGIKAYMMEDEFLQLANRSSNPLKRFFYLWQTVWVLLIVIIITIQKTRGILCSSFLTLV